MTTNLDTVITEIMDAKTEQDIRKALIAYLHRRDAATFISMEAADYTTILDQHARLMQVTAQAFDVMTPEKKAA
jgi:hypothetical protein